MAKKNVGRNKIALNKKMNHKLERMAKRLYDYWFVQFDFPDKNGYYTFKVKIYRVQ